MNKIKKYINKTIIIKSKINKKVEKSKAKMCFKEWLSPTKKKIRFMGFEPGTFVFAIQYHIHCAMAAYVGGQIDKCLSDTLLQR